MAYADFIAGVVALASACGALARLPLDFTELRAHYDAGMCPADSVRALVGNIAPTLH